MRTSLCDWRTGDACPKIYRLILKEKLSLTMRWSEAGYLSQIMLTHALRQVSVSLILGVRQTDPFMKSTPTYTTGRRCAIAHLLRPAGDQKRKELGLIAGAKVAVLAPAELTPGSPLRAATIAHSVSALEIRTRFRSPPRRRSTKITEPMRMMHEHQKQRPLEPNKAMERSRILVTDRAGARSAPSIRLAHLAR